VDLVPPQEPACPYIWPIPKHDNQIIHIAKVSTESLLSITNGTSSTCNALAATAFILSHAGMGNAVRVHGKFQFWLRYLYIFIHSRHDFF
jgi:hypothetical protein